MRASSLHRVVGSVEHPTGDRRHPDLVGTCRWAWPSLTWRLPAGRCGPQPRIHTAYSQRYGSAEIEPRTGPRNGSDPGAYNRCPGAVDGGSREVTSRIRSGCAEHGRHGRGVRFQGLRRCPPGRPDPEENWWLGLDDRPDAAIGRACGKPRVAASYPQFRKLGGRSAPLLTRVRT